MELIREPHRRLNPLSGEWVLVSPHRAERPWQGQVETESAPTALAYDPDCYLCPGNSRAGGARNPAYLKTFVFDNDFAALKPQLEEQSIDVDGKGLLVARSESGLCRVMCFSPRHDLTLATMPLAGVEEVVAVWIEQFRQLGARPEINHVQIFENRGAMMGASNPHPHCQIWSTNSIPEVPGREGLCQKSYRERHHRCLLCDYV